MTAVALTGTSLQDGLPAKPSPRLGVTFCPQQIKLTVMQTDNAYTVSCISPYGSVDISTPFILL